MIDAKVLVASWRAEAMVPFRLDISLWSSLSGHSLQLRTSCRKDWLSARKEDSMGARRSSVMIRDGTTEEKERQHDD
jgi:hypothetical protein